MGAAGSIRAARAPTRPSLLSKSSGGLRRPSLHFLQALRPPCAQVTQLQAEEATTPESKAASSWTSYSVTPSSRWGVRHGGRLPRLCRQA